MSVDVLEGEALLAAARKYGRVVQVNTQRRSNPLYLEARDKYILSGRLGKIGLVETYSYLGSEGWSAGRCPTHRSRDTWTTNFGPDRRRSFPSRRLRRTAGGAPSWNTATGQ